MKKASVFFVFIMALLVLSACDYTTATPVFDIFGSPNPLYYGGSCSTPVLNMLVSGPGEGLRIDSIIAAYQLFDGSGKKIDENTARLNPVPGAPSVTYDADRIISVPVATGIDSPAYDFGKGRVDFAATVRVTYLKPSPTGYGGTFYFTSTKSVPILPCLDTVRPPGIDDVIIPPPDRKAQPKEGEEGAPPAPPSCSDDPNNPSCVP